MAMLSAAQAFLGSLVPVGVAVLGLDVDGYLLSTEFLRILANAISGLLIALLNILTFGAAGV